MSLDPESGQVRNAGCGFGEIISRHIPNVKVSCKKFSTFECMEIQFNCSKDKIVAFLVYRPAGHIISDFLVNFESLLIESQMCGGKKLFGRFQCLDGSTKKR